MKKLYEIINEFVGNRVAIKISFVKNNITIFNDKIVYFLDDNTLGIGDYTTIKINSEHIKKVKYNKEKSTIKIYYENDVVFKISLLDKN